MNLHAAASPSCHSSRLPRSSRRVSRNSLEPLEARIAPAYLIPFADPHPSAGNLFGANVESLSNGNIVITAAGDDTGGQNAGAVYLYDGHTGALISELYGSHISDAVGSFGVRALANGNYVVVSPQWSSAAGAVTWCSGTTGLNGTVSALNSLVGDAIADQVGNGPFIALSDGNYVVGTPGWHNQTGAVTWGDGASGVKGVVGADNSLVGGHANDRVGASLAKLSNGNYVVLSPDWSDGTSQKVGAVTWGKGTTGVSGVVGPGNSLVGSHHEDRVGASGVQALTNGNYVVLSPEWGDGTATYLGAATFGNGMTGITGVVSSSNSLVGSHQSDLVGAGVLALSNGNYVVYSSSWGDDATLQGGAATWGNGATGVSGEVSAANSLVGSSLTDQVGSYVYEVGNGNYVVLSPGWNNVAVGAQRAGAVTWCDGSTGAKGVVSTLNSLTGTATDDAVGSGITLLSNGNYVVSSPYCDIAGVVDAGAATWGSGASGVSGPVSAGNSLVGTTAGDVVSLGGVNPLTNGSYVVLSIFWDGAATDGGAATWGNATSGISGPVSAGNSLVGSSSGDLQATLVKPLSNGNYVLSITQWSGLAPEVGAVTWGNGTSGVSGPVTAANSLLGSTTGDASGQRVVELANGNYVVCTPQWDGAAINTGAVTWGNGLTGVSGTISASDSLIGSTANDRVGLGNATALSNGNYVVPSSHWNSDTGAVTWGNGATGIIGEVSATNSLVGSQPGDLVGQGGVVPLSGGNYAVPSAKWDNGAAVDAGALTWANGAIGIVGPVSTANSAIGPAPQSMLTLRLSKGPDIFVAQYQQAGTTSLGFGFQATGFAQPVTLDATHPFAFFDRNHDRVTVKLTGPGTGELLLEGGDLDGADLKFIHLTGTTAKSALAVTAVKDKLLGDGVTRLGELTVTGALASFTGPGIDFTVGGFQATGAVNAITAHALLGGDLKTGGVAADKLALTFGADLGVVGQVSKVDTTQTISALKAASVRLESIHAAAFGSINIFDGGLNADVTTTGVIGSIKVYGGNLQGLLSAASFGAISVTGGNISGRIESTAPLATLGQTKALASLAVAGGNLVATVDLAGAAGAISVRAGSLRSKMFATSFGAVSVTDGDFKGALNTTAVPVGTGKALASLSITGGDLTGTVSLTGAAGPITFKAGDWLGSVEGVSFGAVSITGGHFYGELTSLTSAGTLGATKALASFTVTDGNLYGHIRLHGTSGAITVKSNPALGAGNMIDASIVAKAIASLTVGRNFSDSIVLAGADLGAAHQFSGDDTFAAGSIGAVKIGNRVTGTSVIGAGFSNVDGDLRSADDKILGAALSSIASLTIGGTAAPGSYFAAGAFKTAPKIAGSTITPATDGRFLIG